MKYEVLDKNYTYAFPYSFDTKRDAIEAATERHSRSGEVYYVCKFVVVQIIDDDKKKCKNVSKADE
jgi:hypothetical protein